MKYTNEEKETIITYNNADKEAQVYTCNAALIRRMDKLCADHPASCRQVEIDECSRTYFIPKKLITIRQPRVLSEEQKQAIRDRFSK